MVELMKTLGCLFWALGLLFAQLLLAGCSWPPPPATITVWPDLPDDVQEAAARAAQAWCAAPVGWCPELVPSGGDARIVVSDRDDPQAAACNGARATLSVRAEIMIYHRAAGWGVDALAGILIHEFGHFGIDGHAASGIMRPSFDYAQDISGGVDAPAIAMWCDQQGCPE